MSTSLLTTALAELAEAQAKAAEIVEAAKVSGAAADARARAAGAAGAAGAGATVSGAAPAKVDRARAMRAVAEFLTALGEDPSQAELSRTPERVTDLAIEMFAGESEDPVTALGTPIPVTDTESEGQQVSITGITFRSVCPHHLLPFEGSAEVQYAPDRKLAGFSRVVRLVETVAARLQLQERMGEQIAEALMTALEPHGVRVRIEAAHDCVTMREPRAQAVRMTTTCVRGVLEQ